MSRFVPALLRLGLGLLLLATLAPAQSSSPLLGLTSTRTQLLFRGQGWAQLLRHRIGTMPELRAEFTADVESTLVIATPRPYPAFFVVAPVGRAPVALPGNQFWFLDPSLGLILSAADNTRNGFLSRFSGSTTLRIPTRLIPPNMRLGVQAVIFVNRQPVLTEAVVVASS